MDLTKPDIAHLNAIAHEGKVVVFGTDIDGAIHYTVRQSGFEDTVLKNSGELKDASLDGFEKWKSLTIDQSVNDPSVLAYEKANLADKKGNILITSLYGKDAATFAVAPVKLRSADGHIYLFGVTSKGYLSMGRFILDGMTNELIPKLEVRYRRSKQKLTPEKSRKSNQDSLDFRDIDENPFYEPALQLTFLGKFDVTKPWFSVELINTNEHDKYRWSFFVYTDNQLKLTSVAMGPEGRIALHDCVKIQVDPEASDKKIMNRVAGIVERKIMLSGEVVNSFDSTLYNNQVSRQTKAGMQLMKEGTQVMLSVPIKEANHTKAVIAAISFSVNNQGLLSKIDNIIDDSHLLRGDAKELLLPLTTLDEIKLIADRTPTPMGTITKLAQGEEELVQITSKESVENLKSGKKVKVSGTTSYNGCYVAKNITETAFEIEAVFSGEDDQGYWEVIEEHEEGLVFENMIVSYEKTEEKGLRINCTSHNLSEGDEIKITGSVAQDGKYPVRNVSKGDNSFIIDNIWPGEEVINLSRVKRRGLYFDGDGDYLQTGKASLQGHRLKHNISRTIGCWVYLDRTGPEDQTIIKTVEDETIHLYVNKKGYVSLQLRFTDDSSATIKDKTVLPENSWVHITALWEYKGETTGETDILLARNGIVTTKKTIKPSIPSQLHSGGVQLNGNPLAIQKLHYDKKASIENITVEAWINTDQTEESCIVSFDRNEYWRLSVNCQDSKRVVFWRTFSDGPDVLKGQIQLADNEWHHIAVTYSSETGEKAIYVNGVLDSVKEAHNKQALGSGNVRYGFIGAGSEATTVNGETNIKFKYDGLVADVRIWNASHSLETINSLRCTELSGLEADLVANWTLEETETGKLLDNSRGKQHLLVPEGLTWPSVKIRVPGNSAQLKATKYEQSYAIAANIKKNTGFKGKLSELQIWELALPSKNLKTSIYNALSGGEYGLVGYWKLGGIAHDGEKRISPDFSTNRLDAIVFGETYVSACDLLRGNSLGRAVKFSNDNLVAVSQGATYSESFDFRAVNEDGTFWSAADINNADGMKHPLFQFNYWGKKARTSEDKIKFPSAVSAMHEFANLGEGWFRAKATFTIPEGVNMVRCFEINKVTGKWEKELVAPEEEWQTLNIRKHKIELISNSISREEYTDEPELPFLADNAIKLDESIKEIPHSELTITAKRKTLKEVIEEIDLYGNVQKFEDEKASLTASTKALEPVVNSLTKEVDNFDKDPLNYQMVWKSRDTGRCLTASNLREGSTVCVYTPSYVSGQAWEFIKQQTKGEYKIRNVGSSLYLAGTARGQKTYLTANENLHTIWKFWICNGSFVIHNKATNCSLDVLGFGKTEGSIVGLWSNNSLNNQLWNLLPYSDVLRQILDLKEDQEDMKRDIDHAKKDKEGPERGLKELQRKNAPNFMQDSVKHEIQDIQRVIDGMRHDIDTVQKEIDDLQKKYPKGNPKSTWDAELNKLKLSLTTSKDQLTTDKTRLSRVTSLLANRSNARLNALKIERDKLISEITGLEQSLNQLNQDFLNTAKSIQSNAQKMTLLAKDKQGLKTFGAILGFASPHSAVNSQASSEGNVQLNYFDHQGCMRSTLYDACADSVNSAYEEWLPKSINSCAAFNRSDALATFKNEEIELPETGFTLQTWFYYPPAFKDDGSPYLLNKLTSDKSGKEAVIAIFENRRLGTIVDGFFHDSGWNLEAGLSHGWHHVATVVQNGFTLFYIDGRPVGYSQEDHQKINRQSMVFNGKNSYVQMATHKLNLSKGFSVQCWAKFYSFNHCSRIIDFGNGSPKDNIILRNGDKGELAIVSYNGASGKGLVAKNVLTANVWTHIAATIDSSGTASLYINGEEVAYGECQLPASVNRSNNFIGRSNWSADGYFSGEIHDLQLWGRKLGINEIKKAMFEEVKGTEPDLLHAWSMGSRDINGKTVVKDKVENAPIHGEIKNNATSKVLNKRCSEAVVALGNSIKKDAPFGRLSELGIWNAPLNKEEIKVNSRTRLNGNEPNLLHYYPLNDVSGAQAKDHGLQTKNADYSASVTAIACTAPVGNPGNRVYSFNGVDESLSLPGIDLNNKSFTVEFWVKRTELNRVDWVVFQGLNATNKGLHLGFRGANDYSMAFYGNDLNINHSFAPNQWMHFANVYDSKTKTQSVYMNGTLLNERKNAAPYTGTKSKMQVASRATDHMKGQLADFRVWNRARTASEIANSWQVRLTGKEPGLISYLPLNDEKAVNLANAKNKTTISGAKQVFTNDLPIVQGEALIAAEYQTVGVNANGRKLAMLRRFLGFAAGGDVTLLAGKRIEELQLKWIGNAQFEPTLLGYIEGAPPVPSENLTVNYDYEGATSVQLSQSEDTSYSWMRNKDTSQGVDLNMFLGVGWGAEGGFGVVSKISEGKAGFRGMMNIRDGVNKSSNIRANSTNIFSDRLELRGSFETESKFPYLGNRYVPKNVGYALVVSGLADVFVTQMKRTGRMVGYEMMPVKDVPPDINTITFMINPAYSINGSLDGLVGSKAADDRFCAQVPEMRAQYGSLFPSGYYDLKQAYDLKGQIDRWDKERESYFVNYDATQTTVASIENQTADDDEYDSYGSVEVDDGQDGDDKDSRKEGDVRNETKDSYKGMKKSAQSDSDKRKKQIASQNSDLDKQVEASSAFDSWQKRMENLQIRAAKRNIVNTYVWDADGGMRSEEQSYANTVEHTIGGSFSISGSAGLDTDIMVTGFKFELQALYAAEMTQTMSKTLSSTTGFDLNVRLDGVERKGVTDEKDYPILPGEKVDRYRFMSFYLEGNTDHFNDFFSKVVDPEWLMSNDEEARSLRQVSNGRANKCWRVMHRVTYVERPALMGFGQDLRSDSNSDAAAGEVFNYFDALEQANDALRADISDLKTQLGQLGTKIDKIDKKDDK